MNRREIAVPLGRILQKNWKKSMKMAGKTSEINKRERSQKSVQSYWFSPKKETRTISVTRSVTGCFWGFLPEHGIVVYRPSLGRFEDSLFSTHMV